MFRLCPLMPYEVCFQRFNRLLHLSLHAPKMPHTRIFHPQNTITIHLYHTTILSLLFSPIEETNCERFLVSISCACVSTRAVHVRAMFQNRTPPPSLNVISVSHSENGRAPPSSYRNSRYLCLLQMPLHLALTNDKATMILKALVLLKWYVLHLNCIFSFIL